MRMGIVGTSWWADLVHGPAAAAAPGWELTTGVRGGVDATYGAHVVRVLAAARESLASGSRVAVG